MSWADATYRVKLQWEVAAKLDLTDAVQVHIWPKHIVYEISGRTLCRLLRDTHERAYPVGESTPPQTLSQIHMREAYKHLRRVLALGPIEQEAEA